MFLVSERVLLLPVANSLPKSASDAADGVADAEEDIATLTAEISKLNITFPFAQNPEQNTETLNFLIDQLPPRARGSTLVETYFEHAAWLFSPLLRDELMEEFFTPIYKLVKANKDSGGVTLDEVPPHRLAVLFGIFSIGSLMDLTLKPDNVESRRYYQLILASLSLRSIFDSPEMATVQSVMLMAHYHSIAGRKSYQDSCWMLCCVGSKLAQSVSGHFCSL